MIDDPKTLSSGSAETRLKTLIDDTVTALTSVRETLADLLRAEQRDRRGSIREISAKLKELESALVRAIDTEQKYHDWKSRRDGATDRRGGGRDDDLDLDAVRSQIGCRLARLRECCREG